MPSLDSLKDNVPFAWRHARSWLIDLAEELIAISGGTPTTNYVSLTGQAAAPAAPPAGDYRLYITTTGLVRHRDSGGTIRELMDLSSTQTVTSGTKTFTDILVLNSAAGSPVFNIQGAAGTTRNIVFKTGSLNRWIINTNAAAESGANAGSNFAILNYNDAGANIGTAFTITRSTAAATFLTTAVSVTNAAAIAMSLDSSGSGANYSISGIAGSNRSVIFRTANVIRWHIAANTVAEGGANAGSNLEIGRYNDAGGLVAAALTITRSNGVVNWQLTPTYTISNSAAAVQFILTGAAGSVKQVLFQTAAASRWVLSSDAGAESGANAGSNFALNRYDDAGVLLGTTMAITRSSGNIAFNSNVVTLTGTTFSAFFANAPAATERSFVLQTGAVNRWALTANNTAEGGANAGSDFRIRRYDDAGVSLGDVLTITRSSGATTFDVSSFTISRSSGTVQLIISSAAATDRIIHFQTAGVNRWRVYADQAPESGANAGSNFSILRFDDAGASLGVALTITRSTGNTTIGNGVAAAQLNLSGGASTFRQLYYTTAGSSRWGFYANNTAESGANAGSDFIIQRYSDAGAALGAVLTITRSNGNVVWATPSFTVSSTSSLQLFLSGATSTDRIIRIQTAGSDRWRITVSSSAESGANAGSNFTISRYDDAGVVIDNPISIVRSSGLVTVNTSLTVSNTLTVNGTGTHTFSGNITISKTAAVPQFELRADAGQSRSFVYTTAGSSRWLLFTDGLSESGSNAGSNFRIRRYDDAGAFISDVVFITRQTGHIAHEVRTALTASSQNAIAHYHNSTGTPAPSFGITLILGGESDTTESQSMFQIDSKWVVATHASRTSRTIFSAFDTAAREAFRIEASGTAAMIGFLGANAIVRPTVSGSRGGNAALTSLLTGLANLGLITDSTSA